MPDWVAVLRFKAALACSLALVAVLAAPVAEARQLRPAKPALKQAAKPTGKAVKSIRSARTAKANARTRYVRAAPLAVEPVRMSMGHSIGLGQVADPLDLKSSVALVLDQDTHQVLVAKNSKAVLPIASLTKLMTALVVVESGRPLDETIAITQDDIDTEKGSGSRLRVGTELTRGEMLHLALMSSENRAANALGRHHPGGLPAFVQAMNAKAQALGMPGTRYVEPTGLSSQNQSNADDLAVLVGAAHGHQLIRELSTSPETMVSVGSRAVHFRNTNRLISNPSWEIGLQKTGYISEAGRCLVMQVQVAGRKLIMVFLDSAGKYSRLGDAERIRQWLALQPGLAATPAAGARINQ